MSTLFIDDQYLKDNSPIGKSIDVDEIYSFVYNSQEVYSQDLLGTPLYNDFQAKASNLVSGTGSTFSASEWALFEIVSKSLVYWTVYTALPHIFLKIRNAGVVKSQSENTQNTDLTELKYLREEMKNLAEFWATRGVNYLCANSTDFPLYNAASDDMYPSTRQWDSDIYLEEGISDMTLEEIRFLKKYLG
jgi:hypothetical protein